MMSTRGRGTRRGLLAMTCALSGLGVLAGPAGADFPYADQSGTGDYSQFKLPHSAPRPSELGSDFVFQSTAEAPDGQNTAVLASPYELKGVRGAHVVDEHQGLDVGQAFDKTTGRPDVTIAVLDSGIEWDNSGAMLDLRRKIHLNKGELPVPNHLRTSNPLDPVADTVKPCSQYTADYDANGDGVFNVEDYACDSRVEKDGAVRLSKGKPRGNGVETAAKDPKPAVLDPQDLLIAFSDGKDGFGAAAENNGYVDDIAGWDFLDNDNDPYDDVQYGHGTGEARDSNSEANNGGDLSTCPNCMVFPLRVGDSFLADSSRFGEAVTYGVDNGVSIIQEALGAINNTQLAREGVDYAYKHGVTVIASAADEAAEHHNPPSTLPHVIVVNSVRKYDDFTSQPRSYLQFNGCTNFSPKITVSIPSVSCSSAATGLGAGEAGLIYSAALNAIDAGQLERSTSCTRVDGQRCPLTANEVRQIMATGDIKKLTDARPVPQADDVDFASDPSSAQTPGDEPNCTTPGPVPTCTDPFFAPLYSMVTAHRQGFAVPFVSRSYPARRGHDQFYGYGRVNLEKGTSALLRNGPSFIPPEVEITSPDWFSFVDPASATASVGAQIHARGRSYTCKVFVAPGSYPEDNVPPTDNGGDFKQVPSGFCNGTATHTEAFDGTVAQLNISDLKKRFPSDPGTFDGPLPPAGTDITGNGRPNKEPFGFAVKVVATTSEPSTAVNGPADTQVTGQDRRALYLHKDKDTLGTFPKKLLTDAQSSPLLVDLDGDNRNELVYADGNGTVHAYRADGSEMPGWPVRSDRFPYHDGSKAFASGEVSNHFGGTIVGGLAAADLHHDGTLEVLAADYEGNVYAWDSKGKQVFHQASNPNYSGRALSPFVPARKGKTNRTQRGFLNAPVVADLDRDGQPEIIAASLDRHVYAWHDDGKLASGFPVEVVDPAKVASIDPTSHQVKFKDGVGAELNQGAIVDTPAVGDITGDGKPEIVVGTNEEYKPEADGGLNAGGKSAPSLGVVGSAGVISPANGRVFALKGTGGAGSSAILPKWPFKVARLAAELLPLVGEGITGSPIIGPVNCSAANGGNGQKVGVMPDAGVAYILDKDAKPCQGSSVSGDGKMHPDGLQTNGAQNAQNKDTPVIPAVGQPAFAPIGGKMSFIAPTTGVVRALDLAANEYQGGQDSLTAWDASTGQFQPGFPAPVNDLQFLTGPSISDINGQSGNEIVGGSASLDLNAFNETGQPIAGWPKLTTDWTIANPVIGAFGIRETDAGARKVVIGGTRSGYILGYRTAGPACSSSPWPRFHHDLANSGDYTRDASPPGTPSAVSRTGGRITFNAPGDDNLCGKAKRYVVVTSKNPITGANFSRARSVDSAGIPAPANPGTTQTIAPQIGLDRYVAFRAEDEQGNVSRTLSFDTGPGKPLGAKCIARSQHVSSHGIGPVHIGYSVALAEHRLGRPVSISRRRLVYCVNGGGLVIIGLNSRGRAQIVASTTSSHRARRSHPGTTLRHLRLDWRHLSYYGAGVYVTDRHHRVIFGVRNKRVRYVGAADTKLISNHRGLRGALHSAGL